MTERKRTKGQTAIYKALYRKLKIKEHEYHLKLKKGGEFITKPKLGRIYT
jgi:hypothetical protein